MVGVAAIAAIGVSGLPAVTAGAQTAPRSGGVAELERAAGRALEVHTDESSGRLRFLASDPANPITGAGDPTHNAAAVVTTARADLGAPEGSTFEPVGASTTAEGTGVRFQQEIDGVPVLGGEVSVQTDASGRVLSMLGETTEHAPANTAPAVSSVSAADLARRAATKGTGLAPAGVANDEPELLIYDPDLVGAPSVRGTRLVWQVRVTAPVGPDGAPLARLVLIDATDGAIALDIDDLHAAKDRKVCDRANTGTNYACTGSYARIEGGPVSAVADVNNAYNGAGEVYDFFNTRFGRDSLDGAGMSIISTVRWCQSGCPYNNAFWDGEQIVYGPNFTADDVVGHELTHGITQHEANLFYFMQSGAINESMSDIFGELVDLTNARGNDAASVRWKLGEDLPTGAGRDLKDPTVHGQADRMRSPLYWSDLGDNGGVHRNSGVGNKAAYLIVDGATFNGQSVSGIGIDKAARIYYAVLSQFLVSGSDYGDLYRALPQACTNLIGTIGITAGDCAQVKKAVVATEMDRQPVTGAAVPDAPACDIETQAPVTTYSDDFETGTDGWSVGTDWLHEDGTQFLGDATMPNPWATSGTRSMLAVGTDVATDRRLTRTGDVAVPAGTQTYLRFNHFYDFEPSGDGTVAFEGGVLEYSTNGGGAWSDAGALITENGYNGTVTTGFANPLGGRAAWTRNNWGYQTVRMNLAPLAGQNVRFRWRMGTDNELAWSLWLIDDVVVSTCASTPAGYHPLAPSRLLDTRDGTGGTFGQVAGGSSIDLTVTGRGGVPATGVSAVVLNVTAVSPNVPSHVTVWPAGVGMPLASNLNFVGGQTIPNLVKVGVGANGRVSLFNNSGGVQLLADVVGWYDDGSGGGDRYNAVTPKRLLDTRDGTGGTLGKVVGGTSIDLTVTGGTSPVPADATAVAINMTVTDATAASHLSVWPTGQAMPNASNLNFGAGLTIPNLVIVGIGTGGKISIFNNAGQTNIIGDVVGYYRGSGARFVPLKPARVLDTRDGTGGTLGQVAGGNSVTLTVATRGGVPPTGATAVVLNVTAVGASAPSHVTVWPANVAKPDASNLNFSAGQTIPNLVMVGLSPTGQAKLFNNSGNVHLIADVVGYFTP